MSTGGGLSSLGGAASDGAAASGGASISGDAREPAAAPRARPMRTLVAPRVVQAALGRARLAWQGRCPAAPPAQGVARAGRQGLQTPRLWAAGTGWQRRQGWRRHGVRRGVQRHRRSDNFWRRCAPERRWFGEPRRAGCGRRQRRNHRRRRPPSGRSPGRCDCRAGRRTSGRFAQLSARALGPERDRDCGTHLSGPQFIDLSGLLGARVHTACVDTGALTSHARLDSLIAATLREAGLTAAPADCGCDYVILFVAAPIALGDAALSTWKAAATSAESYVVQTASSNGRATATLYAASERAALYALRAATALALPDPDDPTARRIGTATIVDYPVVAERGVIEGIYGCQGGINAPYSPRDRGTLLRLMSRARLNTYIYSPKCDPYARATWRLPYPETGDGNAQAIQTALHEANADLVDFVWAISPGLAYNFTSSDFSALTQKLDAMNRMGVQRLALFLDDLPGAADAAKQGDLVSQIEDYVRARYDHPNTSLDHHRSALFRRLWRLEQLQPDLRTAHRAPRSRSHVDRTARAVDHDPGFRPDDDQCRFRTARNALG